MIVQVTVLRHSQIEEMFIIESVDSVDTDSVRAQVTSAHHTELILVNLVISWVNWSFSMPCTHRLIIAHHSRVNQIFGVFNFDLQYVSTASAKLLLFVFVDLQIVFDVQTFKSILHLFEVIFCKQTDQHTFIDLNWIIILQIKAQKQRWKKSTLVSCKLWQLPSHHSATEFVDMWAKFKHWPFTSPKIISRFSWLQIGWIDFSLNRTIVYTFHYAICQFASDDQEKTKYFSKVLHLQFFSFKSNYLSGLQRSMSLQSLNMARSTFVRCSTFSSCW